MLMGMLRKVVQDEVAPEIAQIQTVRDSDAEVSTPLQVTNKRLDDFNAHLLDHSRRIGETHKRIDTIHADLIQRINETNERLTRLYEGLNQRLTRLEQKVEELAARNAA